MLLTPRPKPPLRSRRRPRPTGVALLAHKLRYHNLPSIVLPWSDQLALASQAVTAVSAGQDVAATAQIIVEQAARATGVESVQLYGVHEKKVELLAADGVSPIDWMHCSHAAQPVIDRAAQTRKLEWTARDWGTEPAQGMLAVPLLHREELVAVLALGPVAQDTRFNDMGSPALQRFAVHAAAALVNARRYADAVQLYREVHEAHRLKSEFIATVSHELRTPMGAIMGYAELLASGMYGATPDTMHDPLNRLKANADALLLLINQMLDLSRIEAGRLELHLEPFHPADLLAAVAAAAQPQLQGKRIAFESVVLDSVPNIVLGDVGRLRQMLGNLVDNGIKFTQRGAVVLRCSRVNDLSGPQLVFDVTDSGPGITTDKLEAIWQPFRQGNGSETRAHRGAGLGLTIVQKLAALMGGSASVTSELGIGSTFSIRLPLRLPQP